MDAHTLAADMFLWWDEGTKKCYLTHYRKNSQIVPAFFPWLALNCIH